MKYLIINTDKYNLNKIGKHIFNVTPILSGQHKGKFATSENALKEFPEIFENEEYEIAELCPSDFQIDYTPPQMSGYGVIIPSQFEWVFKNDKFTIGDFVVNFNRVNNQLVVDTAYLEWQAFKDELDTPQNKTVKESLMDIWDYVAKQIENNNFVQIK